MLPGMPPLSLSSGPTISGATASGISLPTSIFSPFTFDNSNWSVMVKSEGSQSATSKAGGQTMPGGFSAAGGLPIPLPLLAIGVAAWLLLR